MSEVQPLNSTLGSGFAAPAEEARVARTTAPGRITVVLCDEALGF